MMSKYGNCENCGTELIFFQSADVFCPNPFCLNLERKPMTEEQKIHFILALEQVIKNNPSQEEITRLNARIISLKAACSIEEYDTADYITHVHKANDELRAKVEKIEGDTGGGCSVCGELPAINIEHEHEGTDLWLCGDCISGRLDELKSLQTPSQGTIDAMSNRLRLISQKHLYSEEIVKELHKAMLEAVYKVKMDDFGNIEPTEEL